MDEKDALKKFLTTPPVKKIDLHFPLGLEVTARNMKGVTIKDALDAIYKQFRKKVRLTPPDIRKLNPSSHFTRRVKRIEADNPRPSRLMMNSRTPSSQASSGTRRSHGHD